MAAPPAGRARTGSHRFLYSLRSRTQLFMLLVALIPLTLLGAFAIHIQQQHVNSDIARQLAADLATARLAFQAHQERIFSAVRTAANDNTVRTTARLQIFSQLEEQLAELALQQGLDVLVFVDTFGRMLAASTRRIGPDSEVADHPLLSEGYLEQDAVTTRIETSAPLLYLLEHAGRRTDAGPNLLVEAVAPVYFRERFLGVVLAVDAVAGNAALGRRLLDSTGCSRIVFFAGNRVAAVFPEPRAGDRFEPFRLPIQVEDWPSGEVAALRFEDDPAGEAEFGVYTVLSGEEEDIPASMACFRRPAVFLELLNRMKLLLTGVFLVAACFAAVLAGLLARSLALPLHRVAQAMERLEAGEAAPWLPVKRQDEIGALVQGFNRMAATIRERMEALEQEVAQRTRAQQALEDSLRLRQAILESIASGVVATDHQGRITLVNREGERLLGRDESALAGRLLSEVLVLRDPHTGKICPHPLDEVLASGEELAEASRYYLLQDERGGKRLLAVRVSLQRDARDRIQGAVFACRDVTLQRRLEEEVAKTQKLESVGVLAGGLAHDFNNLLTVVIGNLSLALLDDCPEPQRRRHMEDAMEALERATGLTRQLLTFSRGGAPVKRTVSLLEIVRKAVRFNLHGTGVRAVFELADDLWPVEADEGQLAQVLGNLTINAVQAMNGQGEVRVSGVNVDLAGDTGLPLSPGPYVLLSIEDSGCGIPPEHLDRIFDPYFSTKEGGSGLGLAISYAIVHKHGGYLTAESAPGQGTVFFIYLPASRRRPLAAAESPAESPAVAPGQGRILVMDDEEMIRRLAKAMLEGVGYQVGLAANGQEAVAAYGEAAEAGTPYDLVLMDLTVVGGMGGVEAMEELRRLDPDVAAVVSSGYSNHPVMSDPAAYGFRGVVTKPYRRRELLETIQRVLAERNGAAGAQDTG